MKISLVDKKTLSFRARVVVASSGFLVLAAIFFTSLPPISFATSVYVLFKLLKIYDN